MFYSQFILAKKGPLGTIWIAAHLERKLRKNQVADTDIGVSVDSILFPEVPIALRLSSHLLLGVVRIYNKKVNYLFDDCSEALLKIKQAFRSTTVDLPPEESKAPYHSITLPETFDLDDFELPDNDIFPGNYVDHHVSSMEQITLQDTMDGVSYSTSKFGLDERFGDGDTSRLDLDEELFLDKTGTAGYAAESAEPQASIGSMTPFKQDEHPEDRTVILDTMADGVHEYVDFMDDAQAPCTPVLVEEPNLSNVQEVSACDDHLESEYHLTESGMRKNAKSVTYEDKEEVGWCSCDDTSPNSVPQVLPENGYPSGCLEIEESRLVKDFPIEANSKHTLLKESTSPSESRSDLLGQVDKFHHDDQGPNGIDWGKTAGGISGLSGTCQQVPGGLSAQDLTSLGVDLPGCLEISSDPEKSCPDTSELVKEYQGNDCCGTDSSKPNLKENHVLEPTSCKDIHAAFSETDGQLHGTNLKDSLVDVVLPAPEKLLSVPDGHADLNRDVVVECSHRNFEGLGEGDAGSKFVTGKKRSFSESTLTEKSLNSVESSRVVRVKRTAESVPDDDDLLSSILVGRRSSILKVKQTPSLSEMTFTKPSRSAPRALKRKVLMDTTMVLHGDTIRQQLTSTKDIRRLRKKAPCTRPEISMIQKQYLEDEIFLEAIFTGMAIELDSLHCQVYDLNGIRVCQNDTDGASLEIISKSRLTSQNDDNSVSLETMAELELACHDEKNITSLETLSEPHLTSPNDENGANQNIENDKGSSVTKQNGRGVNSDLLSVRDNVIASPSENPLLSENGMDEVDTMSTEVKFSQKQLNFTIDMDPVVPQQELLPDVSEVETSQENDNSIAVISVDESLSFIRKTIRDIGDASCGMVHPASLNETGEIKSFMNVDSPAILPDHKLDASTVELNSMVVDVNDGQEIDRDEVTGKDGNITVGGKTELGARDDILSDVAQEGVAVQLQPNESEIYDSISGEQQIVGYSIPAKVGAQEDGLMYNNGQNSDQSEAYKLNMVDAGISGLDPKDRDELHYLASGNDTGFLNVDDDELTEIADDCMADAEETQFTENSGWSSRTRAVSKYLQSLFVKETECGRKSLSLDLLLIGKSRKEASRMFFEALVLKTRDYVHVEQRNPFDDITIKPQPRMMKSKF